MSTPTSIVAYLALFTVVGFLFIFVNLLVGRFLRPKLPSREKLEIYECGEPTIGSSFVQFDLRFYVVALLFIIFDVEVAFFFPWAAVYGKVTHLMDPHLAKVSATAPDRLTPEAEGLVKELGASPTAALPGGNSSSGAAASAAEREAQLTGAARKLAMISLADIGAFFFVLMMGFAYVWWRGDLDWVRALSRERAGPAAESPEEQLALTA